MKCLNRILIVWLADGIDIECVIFPFDIRQNRIVLAVEGAPDWRGTMIGPDNFVKQMVGAEEFIQQETGIGIGVPIEMKIKRAIRRKQPVHQRQALIEKIKIGIQIFPVIVITLCQFPVSGLRESSPSSDARGIFAICKKWRVSVNEMNLPFVFGQQRRHDR